MREVRFTPDGWDAYVKPFRSIEDVHVLTAVSAWLSTQRLPANTHAVAASATTLPMNCGSAQPARAGGRP